MDLLIAPGAPDLLMAAVGALLALLGLVLAGRPPLTTSLYGAVARLDAPGRLVAGQAAGLAGAALLLLTVVAGGLQGGPRALLVCGALAAYLGFGIVLPRQPERRREREAAALRRLTPGLIAFVRVALGSFEAPIEILRRYTARPHPRLAPMQALVAEALQTGADLRLRPFAALSAVARTRGCRELCDVAEALAQAEAEGGRVEAVLAAQQATLELILQGEFKRAVRRRTMYLLLMVAISLVVGILGNLLFVMTGGGSVLGQLG
ncbi:MAG: hypothetical protein OHK0015_45540 [Chloroflexi bacterium OHK40]